MSDIQENFALGAPEQTYEPVKSWQMVTNQNNLFYMIAAGMIMPPSGFANKYYQDTASTYLGYLPIFPVSVSQAAVEYSISEREHLLPCIVNLRLTELAGPVKIITQSGEVKDVRFPDEVDSSCLLMLIPAPLPTNFVDSIIFRSREDKARCESDATDFNNVDLSPYQLKVTVGAFTKFKNQTWPINSFEVQPYSVGLGVPMAAGAMMGLLLSMNNHSDLAIYSGKLAFDPDIPLQELGTYPVIAAMAEWLQKGMVTETGDVSQKLYWNIVSRVADTKYSTDAIGAIDVTIDYLENMAESEFEEKTRDYGKKLAADLRAIFELADSTISEMFERHPKPVSRAMTLFVLREKIEDLMAFKNPNLTEADYILAAILFAAREGWIGLSKKLRQFPGLSQAASHRMAIIAHRIAETGISFGTPPARPRSLPELLIPSIASMSKGQKEAALHIARELKWDCIRTYINLGKGDYGLHISAAGAQLTLDGDIKAVITEVSEDKFAEYLRNSKITGKLDRKVREILKATK